VKLSDSLPGLASIIIPSSNPLESTRQCIAALMRYTRRPWELIVIDDGSSDETSAYLESLQGAVSVPVIVITNVTSRGIAAAINQGLKAARGEYLVLLNNDVVVTDGWLGQLIALANAKGDFTAECAECAETDTEGGREGRPAVDLGAGSGDPRTAREREGRPAVDFGAGSGDPRTAREREGKPAVDLGARSGDPRTASEREGRPAVDLGAGSGDPRTARDLSSLPTAHCLLPTQRKIGLVGPMSNQGAAPQCVGSVPYRDLPSMHDFARRWRDEHRGTWFTVAKLSGACILMKRTVYETVGGLDERSGPEAWADDLAVRARRAGFALAVAHDLFVHQSGDGTDASSRVAASWDQGAGFFDKLNGIGKHAANKILFASVHSILDFSNGASVATMDVLQGLTARGFECQAFCAAKLDLQTEVSFEKMIGDLHEPFDVRPSVCGTDQAPILYTRRGRVPITFIRQSSTRHVTQSHEEVQTVLRFFAKFLDVFRPDVLFTYGGDAVTQGMIAVARHRRIPVVFAIHNFGYTDARHFSNVDYCFVPSEFAQAHYRDKLGLECRVLPNPVDWERVRVEDTQPRYLTFVNPALYKGAYPFVRIAQELGRRRPDIPLLVVESRATKATLGVCGLRPADHPHIHIMPVTTDPRRFWRLTKVLLMPSLWWESQGLVAVEAMINGIPVVASDRGALPGTLGDGGIALSLPDRLTPTSQVLPTAEEVEPWVEAVIRLWDDPGWYQEQSTRGRQRAQVWHHDRLRPLYAEFFGAVCGRSGDAMARRRLNHANAESGIRLTT
jgi:GT2 family glycosyltransferase/glycosyltransferase involved in cell wall biosynthesis